MAKQKKKNADKLAMGLSGISGEYFVAAELSRRGFMASITLRNSDSIDIHASKLGENKMFLIQVKTYQGSKREWQMKQKHEERKSENLFYVFVCLNISINSGSPNYGEPEYFIVRSEEVADTIKAEHIKWMGELGKNGQEHNDNDMRKFRAKEGHKDNWSVMG